MLKFAETADYENPQDRAADPPTEAADYLLTTPLADAAMNTYDVVVRAIENRSVRQPASERSWPAQTAERHVQITVVNVGEDGVITLQWRQPELGTEIMAMVMDADGPAANADTTITVDQLGLEDFQRGDRVLRN